MVYSGHPQNGPKYGGHWNGVKMSVAKDLDRGNVLHEILRRGAWSGHWGHV